MVSVAIPPFGSKIGFSNNIGTGNFVILSNATVVNPSGEQVSIVSTSVNDTLAGTNVQKVKLRYFNTNWGLNDEIIATNGTTTVLSTATDIFRIESFEAFQVGSGSIGAAGTITVKNLAGTSLFAQIDPTNNTFTRAIHFVSPGKRGYIYDLTLNCSTAGGIVFLVFRSIDNTSQGGNIVLIPDIAFLLAGNVTQISLQQPVICDASQSTQGLQMGIAVKSLAASQIGMASFHFSEIS
jgi:hypothetical protein